MLQQVVGAWDQFELNPDEFFEILTDTHQAAELLGIS